DRMQFAGAGDQEEVRAALARSTVLACPCRRAGGQSDALPVVLIEAMPVGGPRVATSIGGIPEIVRDGQSGLLVAPDDPAAFAAAISRLLSDADLRQHLVAGGRRVAAQYDLDRSAAALRSLF